MKKILGYKPIHVFLIGMLIHYVFYLLSQDDHYENEPIIHHVTDLFLTIVITFVVWYGSFAIDAYLDKRFPWEKYTVQHIVFQIIFISLYSAFVISAISYLYHIFVCESRGTNSPVPREFSVLIGVLVAFLITAIHTGNNFFVKWKKSLLEVERYRKESIEAKYESLRNQVNPHFLFNSFSVLSSLISIDSEKAEVFVNKLSKVYRYTLDNNDKELVELGDELDFIRSYIYLLETRFGNNLKVNVEIDNGQKKSLVLPMSLQILIENAVKHNVIGTNKQLAINISIEGNHLVVSNNLQRRLLEEGSNKLGLKNIESRYKYFTEETVEVVKTESYFTVRLPLLKMKK